MSDMSAATEGRISGILEAKRAVSSAYQSGDLETLIRVCDTAITALCETPDLPDAVAQQFIDYYAELDVPNLKEFAQQELTRALLNFDLDKYSFLIRSAGSILWEKVKSANFSFEDSTKRMPKQGKERYDDLKPILEDLMNGNIFENLAVRMLTRGIDALPFNITDIDLLDQLATFNISYARLRGLGRNLDDFSAFRNAAFFAIDNYPPSAIDHACTALKHAGFALEQKLAERARIYLSKLEKGADLVTVFRAVAKYAEIVDELFSTKQPKKVKELPGDIKEKVLRTECDVYNNDSLPIAVYKAVGVAAVKFREGFDFINRSLEKDIESATDLPLLCRKLDAYAKACPDALPYNCLPSLFSKGLSYLQQLIEQKGSMADFIYVFGCFRDLAINKHLKEGRSDALAKLYELH
ncbi:hypothetical protein KY329_00345, partial [Candidatus Woesearchaeota archaeon]|nr:hypothetical protein [Candidatus Woesearchaeota archaeon]